MERLFAAQGDPRDIFNAFFGESNPFGGGGGGGGGGGQRMNFGGMGGGGMGGAEAHLPAQMHHVAAMHPRVCMGTVLSMLLCYVDGAVFSSVAAFILVKYADGQGRWLSHAVLYQIGHRAFTCHFY